MRIVILSMFILVQLSCTKMTSEQQPALLSTEGIDSLNILSLQELVDLENSKVDCTYTLEKAGEVAFAIDSLSWTFSLYPYYFETDSGNYFASNNRIANSIDIYSMETKKMIKRVVFPTEGPGSIARLDNFQINSFDSVYIYDKRQNALLLASMDGRILDTFYFPERSVNEIITGVSNQFQVKSGVFTAPRYPFVTNENAIDSAVIALYNINSGEFEFTGPRFIKASTQNHYANSFVVPRIAFGSNSKIIVRVGVLPNLFEYDYLTRDLNSHQLKSKFHKVATEPVEVTEAGYPTSDAIDFSRSMYFRILYDPYRKVYYSTYLKGVDLDKYPVDRPTVDDKTISIIIADTAFNYLGEYVLPKDTYQRSFWVSREGLMISTSHPKNPTLDEDTMRYATFKIKKID